jgi:Tfp pilus assembly protein PilV
MSIIANLKKNTPKYFNCSKRTKANLVSGFALVEMIIYISIMVIILLAVVNIIISITKSNKFSSIENNIKNSAISGLEEITREIRNAKSIDYNQSVFNSSDGILFLNTLDQNGNIKTIKFYLAGQILKEDIGGVSTSTGGVLTQKDVKVLSMIFKPIDTLKSKAVKIELVLSGSNNGLIRNENFYSTIVLRGSY